MGLAECRLRNVPVAGYLAAAALGVIWQQQPLVLLLSPNPVPCLPWHSLAEPCLQCHCGEAEGKGWLETLQGAFWVGSSLLGLCQFASSIKNQIEKGGGFGWVYFP